VKRAASTALRALVSVSILALILSRISTDELLARVKDAAYPELAAAAALFFAMALLVALRWRLLARSLGLAMPRGLAVRAVFLGLFAGQLLPSSIGSDVVRGWVVARETGRAGLVAASVVADRLVGLCGATLLIALAYGFFVRASPRLPASVVCAAALVAAAVVIAFLAASSGRLPRMQRPAGLALAVGMALLIHATATLAAALSAAAYGIDSSAATWLAIVPVSVIASALPISINGWGVREAVIVTLAAGQGVAPADALLVSLTLGTGNILASLPGAYPLLRGAPQR
jgi:uncharacterized membrane protein YbhN (UPF0104 family)